MLIDSGMASTFKPPAFDAVQVPQLSKTLQPPLIFGPAALTSAAVNGADFATLATLVQSAGTDPASLAYDVGLLHQLAFQPNKGLQLQAEALEASCLFRIRRDRREQPTMRLLALMSPGDLMTNTPLDFVTKHLDIQLDLFTWFLGVRCPTRCPIMMRYSLLRALPIHRC